MIFAIESNTLPISIEAAFKYCEQLTSDHYENFPVASFLIPTDKRKHVSAMYAFARTADDFADEPGFAPAERMKKLQQWEDDLQECYRGNPRGPIFVALRESIEQFDIPVEPLRNLLQAFKSDVTTSRHETFADILRYCTYSANPVGRLVLTLFGYRDESLMKLSDNICTALQLTNFWQDVTVDLDKDRVYLPLEDLRRFGVSEEQLKTRSHTPGFRSMLEFEVQRTRDLFQQGKPLLNLVGKELRFELNLTWLGGMQILRKIEAAHYDVFTKRPRLGFADKVGMLLSAIFNSRIKSSNLEP